MCSRGTHVTCTEELFAPKSFLSVVNYSKCFNHPHPMTGLCFSYLKHQ